MKGTKVRMSVPDDHKDRYGGSSVDATDWRHRRTITLEQTVSLIVKLIQIHHFRIFQVLFYSLFEQ